MEWLLEVGDGPEADAELTDVEIRQVMSTIGASPTVFQLRASPQVTLMKLMCNASSRWVSLARK